LARLPRYRRSRLWFREATAADFDAVDTSNLAIIPRFLPAGAIEPTQAAICRGNIVTHVIG
jgi:hypothetical protein